MNITSININNELQFMFLIYTLVRFIVCANSIRVCATQVCAINKCATKKVRIINVRK